MIGYIKGNLLSAAGNTVILENAGIGYEITCSNSAFAKIVSESGGALYTYLAVREDGISLYGFISLEEKSMFLKLITVSGVGPKMAIGILSNMNIDSLKSAIVTSNVKTLSSVKGLGKKTAERIIVELKEGLDVDDFMLDSTQTIKSSGIETEYKDAIEALISLGFSKQESTNAVKKAVENGAKTIEEAISGALRNVR